MPVMLMLMMMMMKMMMTMMMMMLKMILTTSYNKRKAWPRCVARKLFEIELEKLQPNDNLSDDVTFSLMT